LGPGLSPTGVIVPDIPSRPTHRSLFSCSAPQARCAPVSPESLPSEVGHGGHGGGRGIDEGGGVRHPATQDAAERLLRHQARAGGSPPERGSVCGVNGRLGIPLFPEMGVFAPPSPFLKNV